MLLVDAGARDFDRRKGLHAASAPWIGNHVFFCGQIFGGRNPAQRYVYPVNNGIT